MFKPAVHIIDNDPQLGNSLKCLGKRYEMRVHESASKFLAVSRRPAADCIVLNCDLPELADLEILRKLRFSRGEPPVLALTQRADFSHAVAIMKQGASDLLLRPVDVSSLVRAIDEVLQQTKPAVFGGSAPQDTARRLEMLTAREKEVLTGLLMGRQNKAIAKELGISIRTVDAYRANIRAKTGVKSICEFCKWRSSIALPLEAPADPQEGALVAGFVPMPQGQAAE